MQSLKHPCSNHVYIHNAIGPSSPRRSWSLIDPRQSLVTLICRQYRTGAVTGFIFVFPQPLVLVWEFKRTDSDKSWDIVVCIITLMLFNLSHIYIFGSIKRQTIYIYLFFVLLHFNSHFSSFGNKNKYQLSSFFYIIIFLFVSFFFLVIWGILGRVTYIFSLEPIPSQESSEP